MSHGGLRAKVSLERLIQICNKKPRSGSCQKRGFQNDVSNLCQRRLNSCSTYQNMVMTEENRPTAAPTYAHSGYCRTMFCVW